ncbi:MAG: MarR family winged helix-turn-helix transcriptional regulator [Fimbriimonadaceae bacterium]|nr:MarR family winged helix-turn-helix transcriptional regulator [Alphaproteobacteria bacterium]
MTLETFMPYRLNVLAEVVSQSLARLYSKRYGISIPEWRILAALGQYHTMTAKQVGEHSRMHKTKVSRAVAALDAKGLINRRTDTGDKRAVFLSLSATGQGIYDALKPVALQFSQALEAVLEPGDKDAFDRILRVLQERSEELAEEMGGG